MFGSLKDHIRHIDAEDSQYDGRDEPLSASSTGASSSFGNEHPIDASAIPRAVLLHGEVQTSAGMFRKKKEYLVLTEWTLLRYKSHTKAAEAFRSISQTAGRTPLVKHGSVQSIGSHSDMQTLSDSSGDREGKIFLSQIVAVHKLEDGKPYFALEICHMDEESGHASAMSLQFNNSEDRDTWLRTLRIAAHEVRLRGPTYLSPSNLEHTAWVIERDQDYDPNNCAIFKVVLRQATSKTSSRSSTEDFSKLASSMCFLAVGVHKVHIVQLAKPASRTSSHLSISTDAHVSYGILTITGMHVSAVDDEFQLTFREPLQRSRTLFLASVSAQEIVARLYAAENYLRPECCHRLYKFNTPREMDALLGPRALSSDEEHSCLDRTLSAYCVAYGVNPANIRYTIDYACEDAPRFELLSPADARRPKYLPLELLAIMRALRYNESFGGISFAGVSLDSLNGAHDPFGTELVCTRTKRGTPIKLSAEELTRASMLVQEIRALAALSRKLRYLDFSGCITSSNRRRDHSRTPASSPEDEMVPARDIGCGIVEALFPLCKHQTTNVDWICLNGIELSEMDIDYLVGAAVDKSCHFRAIELNRCGLGDRSMSLILDALRYQENTLESLEIAGNTARLNPASLDGQLGIFGFIRKLNLSQVSVTSGNEPLIQAETLLIWRLQELRFTGTTINDATVDAISTYLGHPQSAGLRQLCVDNTYITGRGVATLLYSLAGSDDEVARELHLDISQSLLNKDGDLVASAISESRTPSQLSMRAIEFRDEGVFRKIIAAFAANRTTRYLDMSQAGLPGDASEDTCRALQKMFRENHTIVELDLSGDDSRLAASKFGPGINTALSGLAQNSALQVLRMEKQKLGVQGASALAEVLITNNTLTELHCDNNEIPLQGLTDLVNSVEQANTTLVHLPHMTDGRSAAVRAAKASIKAMADMDTPGSSPPSSPITAKPSGAGFSGASNAVRKGFNSVRKTARRSGSPSLAIGKSRLSHGSSTNTSNSKSSSTPSTNAANHGNKHAGRGEPATTSTKGRGIPPSLQVNVPSHSSSTATAHVNKGSRMASPLSATATSASFSPAQYVQDPSRILVEQWDRQCARLDELLLRNWQLLHGVNPADPAAEPDIAQAGFPPSDHGIPSSFNKPSNSHPNASFRRDSDGGPPQTFLSPLPLELLHYDFHAPLSIPSAGSVNSGADATPRAEKTGYFDPAPPVGSPIETSAR
jgi:hypothetical protein